jgi:hypothetical protein
MATYKIEVVKKLGKYHAALYDTAGAKQDPADAKGHASLGDMVKELQGKIEKAGLDDASDSVIFRGIAYDDFGRLYRDVARGTY